MRTCSANQGAKVRTFFESCKCLLLFFRKNGLQPEYGCSPYILVESLLWLFYLNKISIHHFNLSVVRATIANDGNLLAISDAFLGNELLELLLGASLF